ncbi:hypothetical protein BKA80DRAFT_277728 [Phyllosticta citrichinensis]
MRLPASSLYKMFIAHQSKVRRMILSLRPKRSRIGVLRESMIWKTAILHQSGVSSSPSIRTVLNGRRSTG